MVITSAEEVALGSFNSSNVSSLGPLILVAFLYQFMATGMGVFARATTQTPIRFRNGSVDQKTIPHAGTCGLTPSHDASRGRTLTRTGVC